MQQHKPVTLHIACENNDFECGKSLLDLAYQKTQITAANAAFHKDEGGGVAGPCAVSTALTFVNMDSNNLSIAITSVTLYLAGAGTTGTRTLAQYGIATALKLTSTTWLISGTGLT